MSQSGKKSINKYPLAGFNTDLSGATVFVLFQGRYHALRDVSISPNLKPSASEVAPRTMQERLQLQSDSSTAVYQPKIV